MTRHNPVVGMMTKVMESWSVTLGCTAQTDLPGQHIEGPVDLSVVEPVSPARDKHVGRHRPPCPMRLAPGQVLCQHLAGRGVQWHQASLTELGTANGQHPGLKIDILQLQVTCLAESQPGDAQQPEQAIVDPGKQGTAFVAVRHVERGAK